MTNKQPRYKINLVKLRKKHFPLFYKWWNDKELRKLTSEVDEKITREEIDKILTRHLLNRKGTDFIIIVNKKPIGHILVQQKKVKKNWEVYIAIGEKNYWGKGIGTNAMRRACRWFFHKFPKEKYLDLEVLTKNHRAIRSYDKVGFKRVKIVHHKKNSDTILMRKSRG